MKGATYVIATSPTGVVETFKGDALRIQTAAGANHWTIHEAQHGDTSIALVGVVPKDWTLRLVLPLVSA